MLHPYQEASRIQISFQDSRTEQVPGADLFALLCGVNEWLRETPAVHGSIQDSIIYIHYRGVVYVTEDLWSNFGPAMACINRKWPIFAFGTARSQETVRLHAQEEEGAVQFIQENLSGKTVEVLENLCFRLDCGNAEDTKALLAFFGAVNWELQTAAMDWRYAAFLEEQGLLLKPDPGEYYCYAGLEPEDKMGGRLGALNFRQKIALWTSFLKKGIQPVEFGWLASVIAEGELADRMEWEMALLETMESLGYRVVNRKNTFEFFDEKGQRRYFGADRHQEAERALMKILFPLNYQ